MLVLVAISSSAGASLLTEVVAGTLQDMADADARSDWRRITVLGTVAYIPDRSSKVLRPAP